MAETRWNAGKRRVFQSVFQTHFSQPTPASTPALRPSELPQSFGPPPPLTPQKWTDPAADAAALAPDNPHAGDQTRFDRSWHIVTSRIALPPSVASTDVSFASCLSDPRDGDDNTFNEALRDVLDPASRLPLAAHTDDAVSWHTQQVRLHFVSHVLPLLAACDGHADPAQVLLGSVRTLEAAHRQYLSGMSLLLRGMAPEEADRVLSKFRRDLHAIVGNSMSPSLMRAMRAVLGRLMADVLGVVDKHTRPGPAKLEASRREVLQLVDSLAKIGLAGEQLQIALAELLNDLMLEYIDKSFAGVWGVGHDTYPPGQRGGRASFNRPRCIESLSDWVEDRYAQLARELTNCLDNVQVSKSDEEKWKEIAVGRLAALRISELFDIVTNWPDTQGAVDDLRYAVTTPQRRLQLTNAFSDALQSRLLHPGRSTLDILRTYIAMIKTFQKLDHSRVLLDRVAYSLQLYLCTREDTVRIIVMSLLLNPQENLAEARKTKLVELAELLHDPQQRDHTEQQDSEWDDLTWMPPPIDADMNYKRPKSEDVIGTLIGALGSPEVFIKEFQNIIGERLLSQQTTFGQEVVVLGLLKKRFGDSALQACDVMIKDIHDSGGLDKSISRSVFGQAGRVPQVCEIHTKILSRLFWPDMGDESFVIPSGVVDMQHLYEATFEQLKSSRKLKWLNHIGQATVELELEDRTILEHVRTYEATVISAFSEHAVSGRSPSWTFDDLYMHLRMDEDLLTAALEFWVKKRVLRKQANEEYVVLERLGEADKQPTPQARSSSGAAAPDAASTATSRKPKPGISEKEKEKRNIYWQFIVSMLTNSGPAMPLGQIAMMMKMLVAGGFPWSNEELQEFLGEKIAEGKMEFVGGKYKLIKK